MRRCFDHRLPMSNHQTHSPDAVPDADADARFVKLESHVAELERMVEELNKVVIDQGKRLQRLLNQHQEVANTVESIEMDRIRATNPKPPHSVI